MTQPITIEALMDMWNRTIGDTPLRQQFEFWALDNDLPTIKAAIRSTAKKNLIGLMTPENRVRFCSGIIRVRAAQAAMYARNRAGSNVQ